MGTYDAASEEHDPDGASHFETARDILVGEIFKQGSVHLVQGVAIMANYLQRHNRPNAGYVCL